MSEKKFPAKTVDEIVNQMVDEIPYVLPDAILPYIKEAMSIYAREQNAELLGMLNSMIEVFEPLANENNIGIDAAKQLIKKATQQK